VTGGSMGGQQQQGPLPPHLPTETDSAFNCAVTAFLLFFGSFTAFMLVLCDRPHAVAHSSLFEQPG
jgi:hypothetical protein